MRIPWPDLRETARRVRRRLRRTAAVRYRSIVVPLLGRDETRHAVDLACLLAADRRARLILVAPLVVASELPLDAHFDAETAELRAGMGEAAAIADSYGVGTRRRLVRTRSRALGLKLADGDLAARLYRRGQQSRGAA